MFVGRGCWGGGALGSRQGMLCLCSEINWEERNQLEGLRKKWSWLKSSSVFSHISKISWQWPMASTHLPLDGTGLSGPSPGPLMVCPSNLSWRLLVQAIFTSCHEGKQLDGTGEDKG